ncbi:MAG: hypothetical protein CMQ44_11335 [Gammaproteobacteria bacterium]|nr:hypothetical protein [Gammaproteobacteria bacterium]|tara:strand:- start:513 stop:800 length:288 start_codon:yes stop_codon:yes gene_type:complete
MQDQIEFIDGLFAKAPHPNAPDFIKANISIKREEMLNWLSSRSDEWINIDVKEARSGKWYAAVDNWQPNAAAAPAAVAGSPPPPPEEDFEDDIPF